MSYSEEVFEFSVSVPTHIEISSPPNKTIYTQGEELDLTGIEVKQVYSSGRKVVIEDFEVSPNRALTEADSMVTISYGDFQVNQNIYVITPDTSGANKPELLSNMLPVYYDEKCNNNAGCWRKADSTNQKYDWYNYDKKMWANAVTVYQTNRQKYIDAKEGTEIKMKDINTMWVWVPRYTYTYFASNTPTEIQIKFEKGTDSTGTINCIDNVQGLVDGVEQTTSQICTDKNTNSLVVGTSTYTHPAFTFGEIQLSGIWVGKFENSATTILTSESTAESEIIIKPNVESLRYKDISYFFRDVRQMEKYNNMYGFEQGNTTTFNFDGELTGDTNIIDTHMMKNIEWGAVAYLSHSKYGINKEIALNSNSNYMTGCGLQLEDSVAAGALCSLYNSDLGKMASTTGNVYGAYDMSGGVNEFTMGNMVASSGKFNPSSAEQWNTTTKPLVKYYDCYTYRLSGEENIYSRGRLGDATIELQPTGTTGAWYKDYAIFLYSSGTWLLRSGYFGNSYNTGIFYFNRSDGSAYYRSGSRSVLVVLD